jgi:hypothetical protein
VSGWKDKQAKQQTRTRTKQNDPPTDSKVLNFHFLFVVVVRAHRVKAE